MSCKHLKFFKERQPRCWFFNNLMLGLETAELTRILPKELRMLICDMVIGFPVYCLGAGKAELGIPNWRDVKCLLLKFSSEPPPHDNWTCWPCLDFLNKFNREEWKERTGLNCVHHRYKNPLRFQKTPWMKKETVPNVQQQLSEDYKNPVAIKPGFVEILIKRDNYFSPFNHESFGQ